EAAERVLRGELRAIRATYRKEAARIEALLATEHTWTPDAWQKLYLDHPITRAVASRLIWRLVLEAGGSSGNEAGQHGNTTQHTSTDLHTSAGQHTSTDLHTSSGQRASRSMAG